ncbi:alpha/beta hydrolase [Actinoplanes sp. NPDC049548]|uniref:alpha/beta fold hydrolase n=1 Tax=Actinoplanes sp. NPDC049548 TaxID=3155152 RepID=UPI00341BFCBE
MALAYRVTGSGRPVLWLHGGGGQSWDAVTAALADRVRSYVPDLRGYGGSPRTGPYGPEAGVRDIVALLDALGLDRAAVVGHSSGGIVAYLLAMTYPERVDALVLEEAPPPTPIDLRPARPSGDPGYDWSARMATLDWLRSPDPGLWQRFAAITARTLVVRGGAGSHLDQEEQARMAERIPGAKLTTIEAGHNAHTAALDEFLAAVRDFL